MPGPREAEGIVPRLARAAAAARRAVAGDRGFCQCPVPLTDALAGARSTADDDFDDPDDGESLCWRCGLMTRSPE